MWSGRYCSRWLYVNDDDDDDDEDDEGADKGEERE